MERLGREWTGTDWNGSERKGYRGTERKGMVMARSGLVWVGKERKGYRGSEEKTIKDVYSPDHLQ